MKIPLLIVVVHLKLVYSYPNVTLKSDDLDVTIYLPQSLSPNGEEAFYQSSRFEHGSMIGSIRKKGPSKITSLYGTDTWRVPHNPYWPESGVGLASEFGVGDDGDFCNYKCGWYGVDNVTNGVLGYQEAHSGGSFLKIGVGELIKGSCEACDSTGDYMFNSPYYFARMPEWKMNQPNHGRLTLEHEAHLNTYGYRIQKDIELEDDVLLVTTTLTNLGVKAFSTAWYSHHFFSCDSSLIGPGYEVEMAVKGSPNSVRSIILGEGGMSGYYEEPNLASWSKRLQLYAQVTPSESTVRVDMTHAVEPGTRIKAEFLKDDTTTGSFSLKACGTSIQENIPELQRTKDDPVSMYGFNLYIEEGTMSPEPQVLIDLKPSQSKTWSQRIVIKDADLVPPPVTELLRKAKPELMNHVPTPLLGNSKRNSMSNTNSVGQNSIHTLLSGVVSSMGVLIVLGSLIFFIKNGRRRYAPIPEAEIGWEVSGN